RSKTRSGNDANLAHSAAKHFAIDAGAFDEFAGTDDHGADWSAEALGEAKHYRVNFFGHVGDAVAQRCGGVEDARAVQVNFQAEGVGAIANFVDARGGVDGASGHVARVFKADERGLRVVINLGPNSRLDLFPVQDAVFPAADSARHASRDRRHGGKLVEIDVTALFAENFVAVVGPDFDGDEVAHAPGWHEESRFLAEDFRG